MLKIKCYSLYVLLYCCLIWLPGYEGTDETDYSWNRYHPDSAKIHEKTVYFKIETKPNFTATLKDKSVTEGGHIKFLCSVTGIPAPRVSWERNGRDITNDSRYIICVSDMLHSMKWKMFILLLAHSYFSLIYRNINYQFFLHIWPCFEFAQTRRQSNSI